jgi:hypothetical protein
MYNNALEYGKKKSSFWKKKTRRGSLSSSRTFILTRLKSNSAKSRLFKYLKKFYRVLNKKRFEKVLDELGLGLQRTTSEWEKFEQVKEKKKKDI